ncbi:MAG: hypothetical protein A3D33_02805 [Candidatus Rokubacteria bacterium RIFCSPHIGHO2_02_FULL_73_26]|nr:MAG: hypothetical protein A3D33_02805 [Candidatus Rokubacteria bacterium RIFCSPHIGHO2_02_FULL_73_26]
MDAWAAILGILGAAVLFVLFGLLTRGRRFTCSRDGEACATPGRSCIGCPANPDGVEAEHGQR